MACEWIEVGMCRAYGSVCSACREVMWCRVVCYGEGESSEEWAAPLLDSSEGSRCVGSDVQPLR